ncbi:MAG TPA: hypothetical protein D7I09_06125, partial [Candidatus Poseidoniales archaeon]
MPWTTNEAVVAAVDIGTRPLEGKVCVRVDRLGGRMGDSSTQTIARSLGARLHEAGWDIDLERPDHVLCIALDATSMHVGWGWERPRSAGLSVTARRAGERPFFRPVNPGPP